MAGKLDNGAWLWALLTCLLLVAYLGLILSSANRRSGSTRVRVEHLREPLGAALNFIGILLALLAATAAYVGSQPAIKGTANLFAVSAGCLVVAGVAIVWFLLGLPNLAGEEETIEYKFPDHWDVLVLPNLAKVLIIIALIYFGSYLLFELRS